MIKYNCLALACLVSLVGCGASSSEPTLDAESSASISPVVEAAPVQVKSDSQTRFEVTSRATAQASAKVNEQGDIEASTLTDAQGNAQSSAESNAQLFTPDTGFTYRTSRSESDGTTIISREPTELMAPTSIKNELAQSVNQENPARQQSISNLLNSDFFKQNPELSARLQERFTAQEPDAQEPVAQEPVAQEPDAQEPVAQEPVAQEPVAQEPVAQEPVAEEISDTNTGNPWLDEMLSRVNTARASSRNCGNRFMPAVAPLQANALLVNAAQVHASDNAANDFLSHTGSDGSSAGDRITRAGYNWSSYGENIAAGQTTIQQVVQGWIDSPGHCVNLMGARFTEFGAGYSLSPVQGSRYRHYWAQVFASPSN